MEFRKKVSVPGILVGSIVDVVATYIWWFFIGLILSFSYIIFYGAASSPTELTTKVMDIFQTNPFVLSITFLGQLFLAMFGGYIAATIAKHDELLNGALSGASSVFLVMLIGIFSISSGMDTGTYSVPFSVLANLSLILTPLLAMVGGYLRLKQKSRKQLPYSGENLMADIQPLDPQPENTSTEQVSTEQATSPVVTGTAAAPPPAQAKKSNWIAAVIIGGLLVSCICLCVGIAGIMIGSAAVKVVTEQPKVESVIDEYLRTMADRDASSGYALFSTRAKRNISLADIEELLEGNNYKVFEGYRSLAVTDFTFNYTSDPDPDMPQGQVAEVLGTISYTGGFTGDFTAVLEQEGDEWRLDGINVNVPPDKFSP